MKYKKKLKNLMNESTNIPSMKDLGLDFEVTDEETAQRYIEFMQKKLDDLDYSNTMLAKQEAERHEELLNSMPRKIRRKYLKTKFGSELKKRMNLSAK